MPGSPQEIEGRWWLPSRPATVHPGVLRFDPNDGATLRLFGSFAHKNDAEQCELIIGEDQNGAFYTLYDGFRQRWSLMTAGFSTYVMNYVIRDLHARRPSDLRFHFARFRLDGLHAWYGRSGGFNVTQDRKAKSASIAYTLPDDLVVPCAAGEDVVLGRTLTLPTGEQVPSTVALTERSFLRLANRRLQSFQTLVRRASHFHNLLSLLMGAPVHATEFTLRRRSRPSDRASVFYRGRHSSSSAPDPHRMFLRYASIEAEFPDLVRAWGSIQSTWESVLEPFLYAWQYTGSYPPDRLLAVVRATEAFDRDVLGRRSTKANPIYLRDRLLHVFRANRAAYNHTLKVRSAPKLTQAIAKLRNDVAHSNAGRLPTGTTLVRVHHLAELQILVLKCALLHQLGIPRPKLTAAVSNDATARFLAKKHGY